MGKSARRHRLTTGGVPLLPPSFAYKCRSCSTRIFLPQQVKRSFPCTQTLTVKHPAVFVTPCGGERLRFGPIVAAPTWCPVCTFWMGWKILKCSHYITFAKQGTYVISMYSVGLLPE